VKQKADPRDRGWVEHNAIFNEEDVGGRTEVNR